jgi:hypothetical protein
VSEWNKSYLRSGRISDSCSEAGARRRCGRKRLAEMRSRYA